MKIVLSKMVADGVKAPKNVYPEMLSVLVVSPEIARNGFSKRASVPNVPATRTVPNVPKILFVAGVPTTTHVAKPTTTVSFLVLAMI